METKVEYDKRLISKSAGFMLVFSCIPVFILVRFFDFGHDSISIYQMYFGYIWLWMLGLAIYWHHKKVLTSPSQYILVVTGLIFNGLVILFLPYIFSDSFTNIFWK